MARDLVGLLEGLKLVACIVLVQVLSAGNNIFYKVVLIDGMQPRVLVAYRYLIATAFLAPLAFFLERRSRPNLTWKILLQSFLSGLFGLERLEIHTMAGLTKVVGTAVGISGAMLLTFYHGPEISLWPKSFDILKSHNNGNHHVVMSHQGSGNHVIGSLYAVACTFCIAIWLIIQAVLINVYPCLYSMASLMCFMASVQSTIFTLCMDRDWTVWKMGFDVRLLASIYTGVLGSGLNFSLMAWCIKKGPLFPAVFNPLILVVVALFGSLLLNEKLHLGSILGAVLIVGGVYLVLFGKGMEALKIKELHTESQRESEEAVVSPGATAVGVEGVGSDGVCQSEKN